MRKLSIAAFTVLLAMSVNFVYSAEYDYTLETDRDAGDCIISGVVRLDDVPTGGILVNLTHEHKYRDLANFKTLSDNRGRFAFTELAAGWYRLSAYDTKYLPACVKPIFLKERSQHWQTTLELGKDGTPVRGRMTDMVGNSLPDGYISIVELGKSEDDEWITGSIKVPLLDEDRYVVRLKPGRQYLFFAIAPGFKFQGYDLPGLSAGDDIEIPQFKLQPEAAISGNVIDYRGRPIQNAKVDLAKSPTMSAHTDENGKFLLIPVATGKKMTASAHWGNLMGWTTCGPVETGAIQSGVVITLKPGWSLTGEVRMAEFGIDENGKQQITYRERMPHEKILYRVRDIGFFDTTVTDGDGLFSIDGLPPGHQVEIFASYGEVWIKQGEGMIFNSVFTREGDKDVVVPFVLRKK